MGILSFLFPDKKKLPINKIVHFERKESSLNFKVEKGDGLNLWNKPETNEIYFYAPGSIGGDGLMGSVFNSGIAYNLKNTKDLFVDNQVTEITKYLVGVRINMYVDAKKAKNIKDSAFDKWYNTVTKKYNPIKTWTLRFYSEEKIDKSDIFIKTIEKEKIKDYYNKPYDAIRFVRKNGNQIEVSNIVNSQDVMKTLRASYSGCNIELIEFKKDNNFYHLELGVAAK